jgi:hypothetical protein
MTDRRNLMRALWCAATAAGGTLRIGGSVLRDYPHGATVTIHQDPTFGDLVISAQSARNAERTQEGDK